MKATDLIMEFSETANDTGIDSTHIGWFILLLLVVIIALAPADVLTGWRESLNNRDEDQS